MLRFPLFPHHRSTLSRTEGGEIVCLNKTERRKSKICRLLTALSSSWPFGLAAARNRSWLDPRVSFTFSPYLWTSICTFVLLLQHRSCADTSTFTQVFFSFFIFSTHILVLLLKNRMWIHLLPLLGQNPKIGSNYFQRRLEGAADFRTSGFWISVRPTADSLWTWYASWDCRTVGERNLRGSLRRPIREEKKNWLSRMCAWWIKQTFFRPLRTSLIHALVTCSFDASCSERDRKRAAFSPTRRQKRWKYEPSWCPANCHAFLHLLQQKGFLDPLHFVFTTTTAVHHESNINQTVI